MDNGIVFLMLLSVVRLSAPIFIAGIGNMYCERVGILNLGSEGMMLFGAFFAVLGSYYTGNPWIGVGCGLLAGLIIGALYGLLCSEFGGIHAIAGLGLNLFAGGITTFLCIAFFKSTISPSVPNLATSDLLAGIPIIGGFLSELSPIVYIGIVIASLSYAVIYKTPFGLRIIAVGDNPKVVETAGINVWKIKLTGAIICGVICGLAGSYMALGQLDRFVMNMISGKGMLAVIAVKMGKWNPIGIMGTALLLGLFDALQLQMQMGGVPLPPEIIQIIPFVAGIIVLALQTSTDARPKALESIYLKNKYKQI